MLTSFEKIEKFKGSLEVPGDKSITHRSILFASLAKGTSMITNALGSQDTETSAEAFKLCGVNIMNTQIGLKVESEGYTALKEPATVIDCGNSGTTTRLLVGILSARNMYAVLSGDTSLNNRPMGRVIRPLRKMGANIIARGDDKLPLVVMPSQLTGTYLESEVASAQVKSAIILAGLQAKGRTQYLEKIQTRDHTERLLQHFGAKLSVSPEGLIEIDGEQELKGTEVFVPGDFSSAAFFIALPYMFEDSEIVIRNVGLNPTRTGFLDVIRMLGGTVTTELTSDAIEPYGNITVKSAKLKGGKIDGTIIANVIDEIPMIATLALFAENPIEIRDAKELRYKESDRINAVVYNLRALGAVVEEFEDGLTVHPLKEVNNNVVLKTFYDHRIAMIAVMLCKRFGEKVSIDNIRSIGVSFPNFVEKLQSIEV